MSVPTIVTKSLPALKRMWLPLLNLVGEKNEFRIIVTSTDYIEFRVMWGLISYERGEKREFVVRGTDAYVNSIISSLEIKNLNAKSIISR